MNRRLRSVTLDFAETAPIRMVFAAEVSASPAAVYRALAEDVGDWPRWFTAVTRVVPTDSGAGREVTLRGGTVFREKILAAQAAERYAYRIDETSAPGPRAMLEEWNLTPSGTGTRVRWTVAADGPAPFRFVMRLGRAAVGRAFRDAVRRLDRRLTQDAA